MDKHGAHTGDGMRGDRVPHNSCVFRTENRVLRWKRMESVKLGMQSRQEGRGCKLQICWGPGRWDPEEMASSGHVGGLTPRTGEGAIGLRVGSALPAASGSRGPDKASCVPQAMSCTVQACPGCFSPVSQLLLV